MHKITLLLSFLFLGICFGQDSNLGECALQRENKTWISEYKLLDNRADQIDFVVRKIIADAYYFSENLQTASIGDSKVLEQNSCDPKDFIRFGLLYDNNKGLILDLKKNPDLEELISDFNSENISSIELKEYEEKDIYRKFDSRRYGVVIYTEDRDLKKKIRKTLKSLGKS